MLRHKAHIPAIIMMILMLGTQSELAAQDRRIAKSKSLSIKSGTLNPEAPPETAVLGRLLGDWDAFQVRRNRDGSWSSDTTHAEWRWYTILDGHGIQDDWISLVKENGSVKSRTVVGTNIRIYNAKEEKWHMAWLDKNNRSLAAFTATHAGDNVVMSGHNAQGRQVRITFSDLTDESFEWQQEWTMDEGETWFPVARISCRRKK